MLIFTSNRSALHHSKIWDTLHQRISTCGNQPAWGSVAVPGLKTDVMILSRHPQSFTQSRKFEPLHSVLQRGSSSPVLLATAPVTLAEILPLSVQHTPSCRAIGNCGHQSCNGKHTALIATEYALNKIRQTGDYARKVIKMRWMLCYCFYNEVFLSIALLTPTTLLVCRL